MRTISSPFAVGDVGCTAGIGRMQLHIFHVGMTRPFILSRAFVRVACQFGLPMTMTELPPLCLCKSTPDLAAFVGDEKALMDLAFAVHALAALSFAHQGGKTMFKYAGGIRLSTDPRLYIQHYSVYACKCSSWDSSRPEGPPMMQTLVFMALGLLI